MQAFGKSQSIRRVEDVRFLTGKGRFVDDTAPADAAHMVLFRSPVAHAEITALDLSDARAVEGVLAVISSADLEAAGVDINVPALLQTNRDGSKGAAPLRPCLAKGRVRHVGEAIAAVIATTYQAAQDALDAIWCDFEELEAKIERAPGGPQIHVEAPDNVAVDFSFGDETAVDVAMSKAAHRLSYDIENNRIICNAMEPRGAWADWQDGRLHLIFGGQNVWRWRDKLGACYGLQPDEIRLAVPDVGGGFGMKAMTYPEYHILPHAARLVGRPVRWMSDRSEGMLSDNHGRDLTTRVELGFDTDLKLTAYRALNTYNLGAYNSYNAQSIQSGLFSRVLTGAYDVQTVHLGAKGVFTNTVPVDAYRGAGRPEAIYALERALDYAARDLGVDRLELRRRNFIRPNAFPYRTATGELYDVGEFDKVLSRAELVSDMAGFPKRQASSAAKGALRGLGCCFYVESILGLPDEAVEIAFDDDGGVTLCVGTVSNGQGHETAVSSFLSDHTGIPLDKIRFVQGDSDRIAKGGGTGGSRSITVQANVTLQAARTIISAYSKFFGR